LNLVLEDKETLYQEYDRLQDYTEQSVHGDTDNAVNEDNKGKNRYRDILPYNWRTVRIPDQEAVPGEEQNKYINASWILFKDFKQKFIASQAPLDGTTSDFWSCISFHKVAVVVMLTTLVEKGKVKSAQYWPDEGNELFGDHEVTMRSVEEFEYFTLRKLSLQSPDEEERDITHIQVKDWGDYSVPESTATLLSIIQRVRELSASSSPLPFIRTPAEQAPLLVHCSAGVGRTGTFIATFRHTASINTMVLFSRPSIWDTVLEMRRARPKMVQKKEQYLYVYQCLRDYVLQEVKQT